MEDKAELQTNNELYKEIMVLSSQIEKLKKQLYGLDTRTYIVQYIYDGSCEPPSEHIPIKDVLNNYSERVIELDKEKKQLEVNIAKIERYIKNYPSEEDMTDEEKIQFQLFLREVLEITMIYRHNDKYFEFLFNSIFSNPLQQYIQKVNWIENSENWKQKSIVNQKYLSLSFFGKTYVYNPGILTKIFGKIMVSISGVKNKFDYPTKEQLEEFINLQNVFLYSIFDGKIMNNYLEKAKSKFIYEYDFNNERQQEIKQKIKKYEDIYEERIQNQELAKQLKSQIASLTSQYEDKMKQFPNMDDEGVTYQNFKQSFVKRK